MALHRSLSSLVRRTLLGDVAGSIRTSSLGNYLFGGHDRSNQANLSPPNNRYVYVKVHPEPCHTPLAKQGLNQTLTVLRSLNREGPSYAKNLLVRS